MSKCGKIKKTRYDDPRKPMKQTSFKVKNLGGNLPKKQFTIVKRSFKSSTKPIFGGQRSINPHAQVEIYAPSQSLEHKILKQNLNSKSIHINSSKRFRLFYIKNLLFLFYTIIFTKYPHQFIYSITSLI